MNEGDITTHTG